MVQILQIVFWFCVGLIVYANVGYMGLLAVLSLIRGLKRRPMPAQADAPLPSISLIIAAHNEEQVIARKLENALALEYDPSKLEIVVASDGSTDRTDQIVESYSSRGVRLNALPQRKGKVAALNTTVPSTHGEILVFSDADSTYESQALRRLVHRFSDPKVGAVTGEERRVQEATSRKGLGESLYVRLDNLVKKLEGEVNSMVMVNGGFFAIRRELYPSVRPDLTHDATVPAHLFLRGYRTAYAADAVSIEVYPLSTAEDFRRRLRTVSRAFTSYLSVPAALNPFRTGMFALQVISHRFLRWIVCPLLLLALLSNILLAPAGTFYRISLGLQLAFYLLALIGSILDIRFDKRPKPFYIPYYFVYIFTAAFIAILQALFGQRIVSWEPTKRAA